MKFLWIHRRIIFFSGLLFYLSPFIISYLVDPRIGQSYLFWLFAILIVIVRTSSWFKRKFRHPYHHPMLDFVKCRLFERGKYIEFRKDNVIEYGIYVEPWLNGYHKILFERAGNIIEVTESEIWPSFISDYRESDSKTKPSLFVYEEF